MTQRHSHPSSRALSHHRLLPTLHLRGPRLQSQGTPENGMPNEGIPPGLRM